ncbi:MAG: hypothetical protein IJW08_04885 [Lentisphaeria bacterium]|nr:hypothetical protein [Lentisphaeria bacterium]
MRRAAKCFIISTSHAISDLARCRKMLHHLHQSRFFRLGTMPQNASSSPPVTPFQTRHDAAKCFIISTGHAFSN